MNDYDKILESFEPEQFQRKDLRKQLLPVSAYTIKLDIYAEWLEELLEETEEELKEAEAKIGRAGSPQYMADAKEWGTQWNAKLRENGELQARLITLEAEKDAEIRRLQLEIEYLQERLEDYEAAENPKSQRKRNSTTGRFTSETTKFDKMFKAYDMDRKGYNHAQISRALSVAPETVKRYIRDYPNELRKKTCGSTQDEEEA